MVPLAKIVLLLAGDRETTILVERDRGFVVRDHSQFNVLDANSAENTERFLQQLAAYVPAAIFRPDSQRQ